MASEKKVLFVCAANICRSPAAAAISNDLALERGLPFAAESAGVSSRGGDEMASLSREALSEIGVYAPTHASRRVSRTMIDEADIVLAMEPQQRDRLLEIPGAKGKVWTLIEYTGGRPDDDIPDPYGLTIFAYRASVRQIFGYVERALGRLDQ